MATINSSDDFELQFKMASGLLPAGHSSSETNLLPLTAMLGKNPIYQETVPDDVTMYARAAAVPYMNHGGNPLQSTWVRTLRYLPNSDVVVMNNNYTIPISRSQLYQWLTSRSLGQWFNRNIRGEFKY